MHVETVNENCANDSENTLVQFLIEVHVLQHQYTNQCTFSRVVVAAAAAIVGTVGVAAAGVVIITSSSNTVSLTHAALHEHY
jgi:uncharacterized membrane protein